MTEGLMSNCELQLLVVMRANDVGLPTYSWIET